MAEVAVTGKDGAVSFTTGSTWENIWHMSWPMLIVMFFNFLVGIADIYVAGFLGPEIQAIVGYVSQLYFFIIIVANAISIGTVAILSRAVGAGRFEDALSSARQSLLFAIGCAIALTATGLVLQDVIISLAGFSGDVRHIASDFFVIFVFALAPNYIVIVSNAIFRAGGEVKLTLLAMSVISLINIALNFLLVFGIHSFPGLGYRGIALATALAMSAGTIICFFLFRRSMWKDIFSGMRRVSGDLVRKIVSLSWPAALIQISWNAGNILIYNILGQLQEGSITAMAALTNGLRIEAFLYLPIFALNMAASVLTGQNLGAGEPDRAERIGWKISLSGVAFVSLMALPLFIWAGPVSSPIAKDTQVLDETVRYIRISMLSEPFMAISVILGGCLMGAGDTKGAMLVIVSTLWIIRLPLAYFLAITAGYGAFGVWMAMIISMFFQGIAMTARFRYGNWKELRL
ncbi:MAG: MATE family efflux transporter [Nitrospiraceae bacterium]|nr:MAG: MATE family efflux transporter [Nitrospiraceae bacterium]